MSAISPSGVRKASFRETFINRLIFSQKELIAVDGTSTLEEVLETFKEHKITSAPVRDVVCAKTGHGHAFVGLIDVFSIVRYTCLDPVNESTASSRGSIEGVITRESALFKKTARELIESQFVAKVPLYVFDGMDRVRALLKVFGEPHRDGGAGCHRAFVVPSNTVSTEPGERRMQIVTKSDVVDYLAKNFDEFGAPVRTQTIDDLGLIHAADWVVTVESDTSAFEAFTKMAAEGVNCLAIVNEAGTLVGHVSASDLRGVSSSCVSRFFDTIVNFVGGDNRMPVVCFPRDANFKDVLLEFAEKRIHHAWIVDDERRPIGVVTLSDLLSVF